MQDLKWILSFRVIKRKQNIVKIPLKQLFSAKDNSVIRFQSQTRRFFDTACGMRNRSLGSAEKSIRE